MILPRFLLVYALLTCSHFTTSAQQTQPKPTSSPSYSPEQCTAAFYSRDSIAIKTPEGKQRYAAIDVCNNNLYILRGKIIAANDHWLNVKNDSVLGSTTDGRKKQMAALEDVIALQTDSLIEIMQINQELDALKPLFTRIDRTADSVAKAKGLKHVFESGQSHPMICPTDQMLMIDISNDVSVAIGVKPTLLRVGTFSTDSLLRLMPGYAELADSTLAESEKLNRELAVMDAEIEQMQHELDSLRSGLSNKKIKAREAKIAEKQDERDTYRGFETYKLDVRDSLRTSAYRRKLRAAVASSAKEESCAKYYDHEAAHFYWTAKEAEFIDLNAAVAEKLSKK